MLTEIQDINAALVNASLEDAQRLQRVMDMWQDICDQIVKDNPTFEAIPDYGDLMPLDQWKATVGYGGFLDSDGTGDMATATKNSNISIKPSDLIMDKYIPDWVTHIIWYNK